MFSNTYLPHNHGLIHLGFTTGIVVDTNDPQQTGRIRVMVPSYGDRPDYPIENIPWATYVSPFGGTFNNEKLKRGATENQTNGPVGYGLWNLPKIGAVVIVTCLDGDPSARVWVGCLHTERLNHTLPHGRYIYNSNGEPDGPLDSTESPIQPLYQNYSSAFGSRSKNYEWRTRGADYSATATADEYYLEDNISKQSDTKNFDFTSADGKTFHVNQGYGANQIGEQTKDTKVLDSQVYCWTTPGFHSISMDDRKENCRIRIRTTAGHQIIFDDTNERIYINTCEGRNWIELDQDGNIDIYASTKINVRTEGDINFTADKSFRVFAHDIHLYAKNNIYQQANRDFNIKVGGEGRITTDGTLHLKAGGNILEQGRQIHLNGPTPANAERAKWTNRVPAHEPWARTTTKNDYTHEPKYQYNDPAVGTEDKPRGKYWRR